MNLLTCRKYKQEVGPHFFIQGVKLTRNYRIMTNPLRIAKFNTPQGTISICACCPPGFFVNMRMDSGIGNLQDYSSIIQKLDEFEKIAATENGRISLALIEESIIVGYFACA